MRFAQSLNLQFAQSLNAMQLQMKCNAMTNYIWSKMSQVGCSPIVATYNCLPRDLEGVSHHDFDQYVTDFDHHIFKFTIIVILIITFVTGMHFHW